MEKSEGHELLLQLGFYIKDIHCAGPRLVPEIYRTMFALSMFSGIDVQSDASERTSPLVLTAMMAPARPLEAP